MKVGDYVRTDTGQIGKITLFEGDLVRVDTDKFITYKSNHNEIIKLSPNIIDLIELGDYVNGEIVNEKWKEVVLVGQECRPISFNNIKSIVTKEQFESNKYKIGE